MPKSTHYSEGPAMDDHAAMKKQWQTNLEIDLLKNAWIRKDREQHGAHTTPPLSAAKSADSYLRLLMGDLSFLATSAQAICQSDMKGCLLLVIKGAANNSVMKFNKLSWWL
ncbi:unnamed protein product [Peronospora destructor]|uniref:Uncharacterized protein n=1 Tax=Peronospora destructor TaxID=86335 RepID=A0AAV0T4B6_9STRA|nr:unnamed protein product [Peronospora destructor]